MAFELAADLLQQFGSENKRPLSSRWGPDCFGFGSWRVGGWLVLLPFWLNEIKTFPVHSLHFVMILNLRGCLPCLPSVFQFKTCPFSTQCLRPHQLSTSSSVGIPSDVCSIQTEPNFCYAMSLFPPPALHRVPMQSADTTVTQASIHFLSSSKIQLHQPS